VTNYQIRDLGSTPPHYPQPFWALSTERPTAAYYPKREANRRLAVAKRFDDLADLSGGNAARSYIVLRYTYEQ
jgi:hypothetical protein